jgi:hypothetical protein
MSRLCLGGCDQTNAERCSFGVPDPRQIAVDEMLLSFDVCGVAYDNASIVTAITVSVTCGEQP